MHKNRRQTYLMPFIKERKKTDIFNRMQSIHDSRSEEAMEHLMSFYGDTKTKKLCSHELEDNLKRELEE